MATNMSQKRALSRPGHLLLDAVLLEIRSGTRQCTFLAKVRHSSQMSLTKFMQTALKLALIVVQIPRLSAVWWMVAIHYHGTKLLAVVGLTNGSGILLQRKNCCGQGWHGASCLRTPNSHDSTANRCRVIDQVEDKFNTPRQLMIHDTQNVVFTTMIC